MGGSLFQALDNPANIYVVLGVIYKVYSNYHHVNSGQLSLVIWETQWQGKLSFETDKTPDLNAQVCYCTVSIAEGLSCHTNIPPHLLYWVLRRISHENAKGVPRWKKKKKSFIFSPVMWALMQVRISCLS